MTKNIKNNKYLDYLGIKNKNTLRNKVNFFLRNKETDFFPMNIIKKIITFLLYIPKKILHRHRRKSFIRFYKEHQSDINKLLSIVEDDISKETLSSQINYFSTFDSTGEQDFLRRNGLYEKHLSLLDDNEYFPNGVINLSENEGLVDCGGFIGDTIEEFVNKTRGKFNHIFSFEIDKINFEALLNTVTKNKIPTDKISCYLKGVYSERKKFGVDLDGIGSSLSAELGKNTIEVVDLDSFFSEEEKNKITYIKMDIEGSELAALQGSKNIIKKNKPKLAICIYHKPEDFWEIPFYIKSLRPDYKIYVRQHSISRTGTVCYAI